MQVTTARGPCVENSPSKNGSNRAIPSLRRIPQEKGEEIKKQKGVNRAEAWERRQTQRREWVHDKIERGRALSDSTGGHWDEK
jgi:hypothetical protein